MHFFPCHYQRQLKSSYLRGVWASSGVNRSLAAPFPPPPHLIPRNSRKSPDPGTQGAQSDPVHNQEGHGVTMTGCRRGRKNTSGSRKRTPFVCLVPQPDSLLGQIYERHPDQELFFENQEIWSKVSSM